MDAGEAHRAPGEAGRDRRVPHRELAASERGAAPAPRPAGRLARALGNRGLGRVLARMRDGDGILGGGVVHPDVEAAIAASRGGGRALDRSVSEHLATAYGDPLADVRVHTDQHASALARAVSARAFTVGSDIFFAEGEYRPGTSDGDRLLAHEVAHVVQQRGAPAGGPLTVSQPGDPLEREADAVAGDVGS